MQEARVYVRLNKAGSGVYKDGVTPAEVLFLHAIHQSNNGGGTFGEKNDDIVVTGEAKTNTGKTQKVIDREGKPERIVKGPLLRPAQGEQLVKGKLLKAAVAEQVVPGKPAVGTPGQLGFVPEVLATKVLATPAQYEADHKIAACDALYGADVIEPAIEELSHEEPIFKARTAAEEMKRLRTKYNHLTTKKGDKVFAQIFPNGTLLPERFDQVDLATIQYDGNELAPYDLIAAGKLA